MVLAENGTHKVESQEGEGRHGSRLVDYISIHVPIDERGLLDESGNEGRLLDFSKAHPAPEFGSDGKLSPVFVHPTETSPSDTSAPRERQRFRVPFVGKINWRWMIRYFKKWIKSPANIGYFIWFLFCAAGVLLFVLVISGLLNTAIPTQDLRDRWVEVINQILNALFMIMCLYQHPNLFHHLVLLCRWGPSQRTEIRKAYCKDGSVRAHEWGHIMFVVVLLHITCISQYVMCGFYWGFSRHTRPDWAVYVCMAVGIIAPVIAGIYVLKSPLGKRYETGPGIDQESQQPDSRPVGRVVMVDPEWVGGLFDCCDDPAVGCCSFFCTFYVFGWNMERLGFGNMYVHIFTFLLLCIAPVLIFGAAALNIDDDTIRYTVGIIGIVLCFFGLLYGGAWRAEMRKKFKLPANPLCCGYPLVTDCVQWLFCWPCSLAQEVRTANFFNIEDGSFSIKVKVENGGSELPPLPREGVDLDSTIRSYSCPSKIGTVDELGSMDSSISFERASTDSKVHAMTPPLPPLIQLQNK